MLRSFSLLELLLTIALVAILTAVVLAPFSSVLQSSSINAAANTLNDLLNEAHQDAITQDTTVEVRLYDIPGSADPNPAYRAFRTYYLDSGSTRAVHALTYLPESVVADATPLHSPLIASNPITVNPDPTDPHMNAQTRVFHFLSDGSTDLPPGTSWFLTLRAATQSNPANFPANWASVSIDPVIGRIQILRP